MKLGLAISLFVVMFLGLILFLQLRGQADPPTAATTAPGALDKLVLPADLPVIFTPANAETDATAIYERAFAFYQENAARFRDESSDMTLVNQLVDLMIEAMNAGKVTPGFIDAKVPLEPGIHLEMANVVTGMGTVVFENADRIRDRDEQRGRQAVLAAWALGQRAFEDNLIFEHRSAGIGNMMGAATRFMHWQGTFAEDWEKIDRWAEAMTTFSLGWNRKYEMLRHSRPKIGDIIYVARYDQDPTFRIMALQRLGMLKYNPGTEANLRAITSALDECRKSEHPTVSRVAEEAYAFTKEQFQRMRM